MRLFFLSEILAKFHTEKNNATIDARKCDLYMSANVMEALLLLDVDWFIINPMRGFLLRCLFILCGQCEKPLIDK